MPSFTPSVRVAADGTVAVTYYDFRSLTTETRTLPTDYLDDSGYFIGDYEGLTSNRSDFRPVFVQTNSGNIADRTDVFTVVAGP